MDEMPLTAAKPDNERVLAACVFAASVLGVEVGYRLGRRTYLRAPEGWQVAICGESGNRLRVEAWHGAGRRATVWTQIDDHERLAALLTSMRSEMGAVAGA